MVTDRGAARGQALASVALSSPFRTRAVFGNSPESFGGCILCSSQQHLWLEIASFLKAIPCLAPFPSLWYLSDTTSL